MSLLSVSNLSLGFAEKNLYENASFELYKGEHVGVVGQNGTGKSTLINILLGIVVPDKGDVKWQSNIKIGHLDQYAQIDESQTIEAYLHTAFAELYNMEKEMSSLYELGAQNGDEVLLNRAAAIQEALLTRDFYDIGSEISKVANGLGIDAIGIETPIENLSGGQRAKVILAKLLLENPNVLLLDEPTNFLDAEHVSWLCSYLNSFPGTFITVSHDFDFLENITTAICDIEFGTIKKYNGNYSKFLHQKEHLREDYIRQYEAQREKIEKTEEYIRKNKAGVNSKMARGRQKQLDRLEVIAPPSFTDKPHIRFPEIELSNAVALTVTNLQVGYYYPLLPSISFSVMGGQKLVITGFNGIGKSTLLKTLIKQIPTIAGKFSFAEQVKIGYYEQDLKWADESATPIQIITDAYPKMNIKAVRRALAQCGVKDTHVLRAISTLSGGEQSKVKLCRMTLTPCNFLILDEPTNHFDAETKESMLSALEDFKGSLILVSHEPSFYKKLADKVVNIEHIS